MSSIFLKIKRGETPFFRTLRSFVKRLMSSTLPLPRFLMPLLRGAFTSFQAFRMGFTWLLGYLVLEPLFRGRCVRIGKNFRLWRLPFVVGHAEIELGDNVNFFGSVDIVSARVMDHPKLILGNRVDVGHRVVFMVSKEIVIEDDVNIASDVRFMDSDAHPRTAADRIADLPPPADEIKPVRVRKYAWIGQNSFILKGVTIGEGAVVGVSSVVVSDVPDYCIVMGNPARVVFKNLPAVNSGDAKPAEPQS